MIRHFAFAVLLLAPLITTHAQRPKVDNDAPRKVLPIPMRAITDPTIVSGNEADITDNELVIGVTMNGESRSYPINQLTGPSREISNDTLGGTAIAATW